MRVPLDGGIFTTSDGEAVCPVSGVVACVALWMLTAAFIERMHLHGKTPHVWRSIKLPDSKPFNEQALSATARGATDHAGGKVSANGSGFGAGDCTAGDACCAQSGSMVR